MSKPIIHLREIKPKVFGMFENCYVELETNIKKELFNEAVKLSPRRSIVSLSEWLDVKLYRLSDSKNRNPISLTILRKLSNLLISNGHETFSLENLEKNIEYIKGMGHAIKIIKPKFPFNFATPSGIRLISKLYHDGGIGKNRQPYYRNKDEYLVEEFCEDVKNVFGKIKIVIGSDPKGMKVALPRLTGDILELTGCYLGNKVMNNPSPPNWIKDLDTNLIKEFIRVAMDDEGNVGTRNVTLCLSVDITSLLSSKAQNKLLKLSKIERTKLLRKYSKEIPEFFEKYKSKILSFDQKLIEKLGVKTSSPHLDTCYTDKKNQKLRVKWKIYISGKNNLSKFYKKIRFKLKHKKVKLRKYLKNTKMTARKGHTLSNLLKMCSIIQRRQGYFTDWNVAKKFKYNHQYLGRIRNECEKRNLIRRVGRNGHKLKFVLTENEQKMQIMDQ